MTVEEALVALLAAVAGILLFLGLAQALDSGPRRRARPTPRREEDLPRSRLRVPRAEGSASGSVLRAERSLDRLSEQAREQSKETPAAGDPGRIPPAGPPAPSPPPPALTDGTRRPEPVPLQSVPVEAPAGVHAAGQPDTALVEACAALFLAGKHAEVLVAAEPALGRSDGAESMGSCRAMAALWSLAALSRQALGDEAEAQAALAAALRVLPESVVEGCPPRLAAMSVPIAGRLLETAEQSPEGAQDRIVAPRLAMFWLHWRLVAAPGDQGTRALLEAAREALSEGYAKVASGLIRRQEWSEAGRLIRQGCDADDLPAARGEVLVEILATSLRHEIERLTAPVIRGAKDESRAVTALERAETVLASVAGSALPPRQWAAMTRRIWRGYARLGSRRLVAGSLDGAADALFHALGMKQVGRRRQRHVQEAVVRTLEAMGDQKVETITRLLAEGNRPAAVEQVERLISHIHRAREGGVAQEALTAASSKAGQLAQQLEPPPPQ